MKAKAYLVLCSTCAKTHRAASALGRLGGLSRSPAKRKAARANASKAAAARRTQAMAARVERINESNERRAKLFASGATRPELEAFDRAEFEARHAFEKRQEERP